MSIQKPAAGSAVRVVLRDDEGEREFFGHVVDVRMMSRRWALKLFGVSDRTLSIDPETVDSVEVVDLSPDMIREIAVQQRVQFDPNAVRSRRGGTAGGAAQKQRKRTIARAKETR